MRLERRRGTRGWEICTCCTAVVERGGKIWTWIQTHARPATVGAEQGSQQYEALANEGEWVVGDAEARQLLEDAEMADILEDVQAIVAEIEALEERACPHEAAEGYPR